MRSPLPPVTAEPGARAPSAPPPAREPLDWSQLWYPGPSREFTDAELARAGSDRPSRTVLMVAGVNLASAAAAFTTLLGSPVVIGASLLLLLLSLLPVQRAARWLWARPTRRRLLQATLAMIGGFFVLAVGLRVVGLERELQHSLVVCGGVIVLVCAIGFWLLTLVRAQQIASRLRELDERERAVDMARQLATAQIQPHFLFNSLASLQHWVDAGDARAAPLLQSLTGYLRATLPLFKRERLTLGEELDAAARYLEVMQARLGERLRFHIEADAATRARLLPPGLLLTLVENAVEHGVQPALHGAEVHIRATQDGGGLQVEVADTGAGLPLQPVDGLGLANTRARLAQAYGDAARLTLERRPEGGTLARLALPAGADGGVAPG